MPGGFAHTYSVEIEAAHSILISSKITREKLQRHFAMQPRVFRKIHLTHPAFAEVLDNAVMRDDRAGSWCELSIKASVVIVCSRLKSHAAHEVGVARVAANAVMGEPPRNIRQLAASGIRQTIPQSDPHGQAVRRASDAPSA